MNAPSISPGYRVIPFLTRFCGKLIKYFDTVKKLCREIRSGSPVSIVSSEPASTCDKCERLLMQDSECVLDQHCKYLVSPLGSWQKNEKLTGCTRPKQKPTVSRLHCDIHSSAKRKTLTILSLPAVDIDNAIITRLKPTNKIQYVTISYPETGCNIIKQSLTSTYFCWFQTTG